MGSIPSGERPVEGRVEPAWAQRDPLEEHRGLILARIEHRVEVREPFVLIAQVQRSGGSLLTFLFDGHPECHVHHGDLELGYPKKGQWPKIDLDAGPEHWFEALYEPKSHKELSRRLADEHPDLVRGIHPRVFLPRVQKAIFDFCVASRRIESERDVLDSYLTSYFNAWLDNQNLYSGPKKVVVGFGPGMHVNRKSLDRFFGAYPDGRLVTTIRDPRGWYASARTHKPKFADLDRALDEWRESVEASLAAVERFGERVVVLTYDELVTDTEKAMARVAERIGISMSPVLLTPTFNGRPKRANSTHPVDRFGILRERTTTFRDVLEPSTIAHIEESAGALYERAVDAASRGA